MSKSTCLPCLQPAAEAMHLRLIVLRATTLEEIERAFKSLPQERPDGLINSSRSVLHEPAYPNHTIGGTAPSSS